MGIRISSTTTGGGIQSSATTTAGWAFVLDEATLVSNSATKLPSQQSVKSYVDSRPTTLTSTSGWTFVLDEDDLVTDSATKLPTQQSVKAYVDALPTLASSDPTKISISTTLGVTTLDVSALLASTTSNYSDAAFRIDDAIDSTIRINFNAAGTTGTTTTLTSSQTANRIITFPDLAGTVALLTGFQRLTGKGLRTTTIGETRTITSTETVGEINDVAVVDSNFASGAVPPRLFFNGTNRYMLSGSTTIANKYVVASATIINDATVAASLGGSRIFEDINTITADTQTIGAGNYVSFRTAPTWGITNGGVISSGTYSGVSINPSVGTGTTLTTVACYTGVPVVAGSVTSVTTLKVNVPTITGTCGTMYGVDIVALTSATSNVGIRNAASTVETPTIRTLTAVGDSLSATSTEVRSSVIELNNTSGGSLTLTSAPTLPAGLDGQVVTIFNSGTQSVVIQDQGSLALSNLRLGAASRTLATRDSVVLRYSSTVGDWIEVAFSNVL